MKVFKKLLVGIFILSILCGFFVIVSNSLLVITSQESFMIEPGVAAVLSLVFLVGFGGICGGLVHALESEKSHQLIFNGKMSDTGAYGHMFIGFCGAYVALAVVMIVFGMDLANALDHPTKISVIVQYMFYLLAIGVIGGYSGLPIISLISNAALKKVQQEVDALKKQEEQFKDEVDSLKAQEKNFELELNTQKDKVGNLYLQNLLLKAESHARNEEFTKAVELLETEFLPRDDNNPAAYHWLALCEKRRGNVFKAVQHVKKSVELSPSRLGFFNLACYLNLNGEPASKVIENLKLAWQNARTDSDKNRFYKGLQDDEDLASLRSTNNEFEDFFKVIKSEIGKQ